MTGNLAPEQVLAWWWTSVESDVVGRKAMSLANWFAITEVKFQGEPFVRPRTWETLLAISAVQQYKLQWKEQ